MPTQKKRPGRRTEKPPPRRGATSKARKSPAPRSRSGQRPGKGRAPVIREPGPLQYKVVELSTVDEGALERTLNEWTAKGWNLDGVQFAMRESSKRPAMAFVFFTREGEAARHDEDDARQKLLRMSEGGSPTAQLAAEAAGEHAQTVVPFVHPLSAHERLAKLAGLDEPEPTEEGLTLEPEE
ncbi:hypothetical protein COCOR_03850 [Corallococcus coralloides DSM 2259]|uniref:DUF4177 domain-containing protein n=1 Tax=Corallococcus coralloides (strain ATCC 25202 / DSM 2259 / NBRC 100086 / M2) TaxID=1144275 RepID=H8MSG7_CORCM|nr:hypothetical protein [Corallococcus coralloides]AFE05471.1 hypothetical protein COCOR_03850 [Corallococcus coralloides DSM 2259]